MTPVDGLARYRAALGALVEAERAMSWSFSEVRREVARHPDSFPVVEGFHQYDRALAQVKEANKALSRPPTDAEVEALAKWLYEVEGGQECRAIATKWEELRTFSDSGEHIYHEFKHLARAVLTALVAS